MDNQYGQLFYSLTCLFLCFYYAWVYLGIYFDCVFIHSFLFTMRPCLHVPVSLSICLSVLLVNCTLFFIVSISSACSWLRFLLLPVLICACPSVLYIHTSTWHTGRGLWPKGHHAVLFHYPIWVQHVFIANTEDFCLGVQFLVFHHWCSCDGVKAGRVHLLGMEFSYY